MAYDTSDLTDPRKKNPLAQHPDFRAPGGGNDLRAENPVVQAQNMRRVQEDVFGPRTPHDSYAQRTANYRPGQNLAVPPPQVQTLLRPQTVQANAAATPTAQPTPAIAGFDNGQAPIYRSGNTFSDKASRPDAITYQPGGNVITDKSTGGNLAVLPSAYFSTVPGSSLRPRPTLATYEGLDGQQHDLGVREDTRGTAPLVVGQNGGAADQAFAKANAEYAAKQAQSTIGDFARRGFGRTAAELAGAEASLRNAATNEQEAGTKRRLVDFETGSKGSAEIANLSASARRSLAEADPDLLAARIGQTGAETGELRSRSGLADTQRDVAATELNRQRKLSEALDDYTKNPTPAKRDALLLMQGKDKPEQYAFPVEKEFNDQGTVTGEHIVPFNKFTGQPVPQPNTRAVKNAGAQMQTKDGRVLTVQNDGTYLEAKTGKKYDANGKPIS